MDNFNNKEQQGLIGIIRLLLSFITVLVFVLLLAPVAYYNRDFISGIFSGDKESGEMIVQKNTEPIAVKSKVSEDIFWHPVSLEEIRDEKEKQTIEYGKDLVMHTAKYFGPKGTLARQTNGLNCQNCHLDAGTKIFGNNYGSVFSTYPKFRERSGSEENVYKRINDCFERSLNGKALSVQSKEMKAIAAYIQFIGSNVEKGKKAEGSGLKDLAFIDRAADPEKGKLVYQAKCQSCHMPEGNGVLLSDGSEYSYPPLWGSQSYNDGAGLFRVSNFARYVKYNMPLGSSHQNPTLSDEEAWDVAAFVNSQNRPHLKTGKDWPNKAKKPIDLPFGPYADSFSEQQHKYGPFQPIKDFYAKK